MRVAILSTILSEIFLEPRKIQRGIIINLRTSSRKMDAFRDRFQWKLNFLNRFSSSSQISDFIKIPLVGAEFFYADGRTDRHDEANNGFLQSCESF